MIETLACPCAVFEPGSDEPARTLALTWNGQPDIVRSVAVPARIQPDTPVTVPALTLVPQDDPVTLRWEASERFTVDWEGAFRVGDNGVLLTPSARADTEWRATFLLGPMNLLRPRPTHVRFILARRIVQGWFATAMTAVSACGALVAVAGVVGAALGAVAIGVLGFLVGAAVAVAAYPPVLRALSLKYSIPLPSEELPVGSIALPAITLEPTAVRSPTAEHPLVIRYCERIADDFAHIHVLGLSTPIDLDEGWVPVRLRMGRPTDVAPPAEDRPFSQVDELIQEDLALKRLLRGEAMPPEEAWQRNPRLTIIGDVGTGKTTILRRIARNLARGPVEWTIAVPIVIELHAFARREGLADRPFDTLVGAISEALSSRGNGIDQDEVVTIVTSLAESGELTVLFDGLDEISGPSEDEDRLVAAATGAIAAAAEAWPRVRLVVTCRRSSMDRYRRLPADFVVAETETFDQDDIKHFVGRYFSASPEKGVQLLDELERTPRLFALATTPLLLALLTLVFEQRGSLPHRITEIYRRCADLLLREWDQTRDRERVPRFEIEHKEALLRRIAWDMHIEGMRYYDVNRLLAVLAETLPAYGIDASLARAALDEITAHHGVLRAHDDNWYGFVHFALQEYYAAENIDAENLTSALSHRHRPWWQEVIRLYAGRTGVKDLVSSILRQREDLFRTNLRLAGECLALSEPPDPVLSGHVVDELRETALHVGVPRLDLLFWRAYTRAGGSSIEDALWTVVADESLPEDVRRAVVADMPDVAGERFVPAALAHILDDGLSAGVRTALADAAGNAHLGDSATGAIEIVRNGRVDEGVRAALARQIGRTGNQALAEPLRELVVDLSLSATVRHEVAVSLRELGADDAVLTVLDLLNDWHVEPPVRAGLASIAGVLADETHVPDLMRALSDTRLPSSVRTSLAMSLKHVTGSALADALLVMLSDSKVDYGVRQAISDTLCTVSTDLHLPTIRALYSNRQVEDTIRLRLAVTLGTLGERDVIPTLTRLVGDRSARPYLRLEGARILGTTDTDEVVEAMTMLLDSRSVDPFGQELAVLVLGLMNRPDTAGTLVDRLSDRRLPLSARLRMADTLATLGTQEHIDRLVSLLPDRAYTPALRGRLALALMRITDARNRATFDHVLEMVPLTTDVPEVITLLWHLGEQVGAPVWPETVGAERISYRWLETGATASE